MNDYVKVACEGCKQVSVWKHKGFWNPQSTLFRDDGVHLNDLGNSSSCQSDVVRRVISYRGINSGIAIFHDYSEGRGVTPSQ